jgi:hypothetical protein
MNDVDHQRVLADLLDELYSVVLGSSPCEGLVRQLEMTGSPAAILW